MRTAGLCAFLALGGELPPTSLTHAHEEVRVELPRAVEGTFEFLSYNIAGLPQWMSRVSPTLHVPLIGPLLNSYDLVVLQEDFAHHAALTAGVALPYESEHMPPALGFRLGDGLIRLGRVPFHGFAREAWKECHGIMGARWDCWAPKGFSVAHHQLAQAVEIDVYNLHMDAGDRPGDRSARQSQVAQLMQAVRQRSLGRAVIVAGDANTHERDAPLVEQLLEELGLEDACAAQGCAEPYLPDRVLFRSGSGVQLFASAYSLPAETFTDPAGQPLSDHSPVHVSFRWKKTD